MKQTLGSIIGLLSRASRQITFRAAIPRFVFLVLLAAGNLSACVVVPIPQDHINGRAVNVDPLTIKEGATTKEDILLRLGDPDTIWNERLFIYSWDHVKWAVLWMIAGEGGFGTGGVAEVQPPHEMLLIQFDQNGLVQRADRTEMPRDVALPEFLKNWMKKEGPNAAP